MSLPWYFPTIGNGLESLSHISIKASPFNEELFLLEQVFIGVQDIDPLRLRCRQGRGIHRGMGAGASIL